MLIRALAVCLLTASLALAEDTYESMAAKTDMGDADQVFALAQWCGEHGKPTEARHLYGKVIKLDPNHEGARAAMGQVRVGDRWVAQAHLDAASKPNTGGDKAGAPGAAGGGSAPTAAQVTWDLHLPRDPAPDNTFINGYIQKLPNIKNDSKEMDDAVATLLNDDNRPAAIPRMCAALAQPGYGDLFGASEMVMQLAKAGQIDVARPMEGFLAKASEHVTDAEDLEHFAFAMGLFKDKRAVPRLIEIYDTPNDSTREVVIQALAAITALPAPSKSSAQEWWAKNWNADPKTLFMAQLKSGDPASQIAAAEALFDLREKSIYPTLIKLMRIDDRPVNGRALALVHKMTGLDFGYQPSLPPADKEKRVALAEKWWKDNGEKFHFPEVEQPPAPAPTAAQTAADQCATWVADLGSITGNTADQAEASLQGAGLKAVPALIGGLDNSASIVRRRCNELLKTITKQDFKFDPKAEGAEHTKAVDAWKQWAASKGLDSESEPAK
jgi:HEAT repeat protein